MICTVGIDGSLLKLNKLTLEYCYVFSGRDEFNSFMTLDQILNWLTDVAIIHIMHQLIYGTFIGNTYWETTKVYKQGK